MVVCDEIQIIGQINEDPRSLKFIQKLSLTFTNDINVTAYVAICDCSSGNHNSSPNLVILVFFFYLWRPQSRSSSMAKKTETVVRQQQAIPLRQNTKFTKQIVQHKLWSEWIFLDISGLEILWLGTLRLKAWACEAICAKETWQGILPPNAALVTAGEVRRLNISSQTATSSLRNEAIFHCSLGFRSAISQLESKTENSPIRPLWPRTL